MENIASLKHRIVKKKQTSPTPTPVVLATLKLMVFHLGKVADASTHNRMDRVNLGLMFGQVQNIFSVTLAWKVDFFFHRLCFGQTPRSPWAWNIFKVA